VLRSLGWPLVGSLVRQLMAENCLTSYCNEWQVLLRFVRRLPISACADFSVISLLADVEQTLTQRKIPSLSHWKSHLRSNFCLSRDLARWMRILAKLNEQSQIVATCSALMPSRSCNTNAVR
jgi:hypothetical protein